MQSTSHMFVRTITTSISFISCKYDTININSKSVLHACILPNTSGRPKIRRILNFLNFPVACIISKSSTVICEADTANIWDTAWPPHYQQQGQHPLTGQRAANFRLLANQWAERRLVTQWCHGCYAIRWSVCNAGASNARRFPCIQGSGVTPSQYIDTTRKAIDCATTLPLRVFI